MYAYGVVSDNCWRYALRYTFLLPFFHKYRKLGCKITKKI